jgi:hypothetical protein
VTLWRLPILWRRLQNDYVSRIAAFVVLFLMLMHWFQPLLWITRAASYQLQLSALCGGLGALILVRWLTVKKRPSARKLIYAVLGLFLLISYSQILYYFTHLQFRTQHFAQHIAELTEPGSVICGDWSPNLCLDNNRRAIPILKGLANDTMPVQRFQANYLLVGDMKYQRQYWSKNAPDVVQDKNFIRTFFLYSYAISLYRVPKP